DEDVVAGITLPVMRLAGSLGAVELAAEQSDLVPHCFGAQERRQVLCQTVDRGAGDQLVAGRAPGESWRWSESQGNRDQRNRRLSHANKSGFAKSSVLGIHESVRSSAVQSLAALILTTSASIVPPAYGAQGGS